MATCQDCALGGGGTTKTEIGEQVTPEVTAPAWHQLRTSCGTSYGTSYGNSVSTMSAASRPMRPIKRWKRRNLHRLN